MSLSLVIDANILFAALIKESVTAEIIFSSSVNLFAPEFLFEEFERHRGEILKKTKRKGEQFEEIVKALKEVVTTVSAQECEEKLPKAREISPDPDDALYLALALKKQCFLWSNDEALKDQVEVKVLSTKEIIKIIERKEN
ncbi:putative toxin-antitoxin system toxin component, PIN family [Candidatus Woesearchaeota archaeon]|nr:putative toxin-antitoxin system toxin component, PIN family [Candidatus Woesearchaeota archaeon]